jgi:outer membrane cobalamin receptor
VNLDDRLRAVPGFSLFRRSSSLVANPTTQGVSLRGLGASGGSRTLVLWDGVPLNDPFGGWIYWTRLAPTQIERIEISRGASTAVFGDRAVSGTIALFSPAPEPRISLEYEGGNRDTHIVTGGVANRWSRFGASLNGRAATTDGYYTVRNDRRGTVDTLANVRFAAGNTRLDWLDVRDQLFVRMDILAEERDNGTVLTHNSTSLGTIAGNYSHQWTSSTVSLLGYHTREEYRATFSAVAADRNTERLTSIQTVPSEAVGAAGVIRHQVASWNLLAGADAVRVEGTSIDQSVLAGTTRHNGGSQLQHATFVQADWSRGPAKVFLGTRGQNAADRNFLSPSAGFVLGTDTLRFRTSAYRAFRAPTLNELYRPFRVGNAETLANSELKPETVFGIETGVDYVGERRRFSVSFFRTDLDDLVTNVTLSTQPNLIVRQRQNAAEALARGIDVNATGTWRNFQGEVAYLFADSRFSTGERIPQVPKHSGMAQVTWARGQTFASAGLRAYGLQFEDDLNQFVLPGFATVQMSVVHALGRGVSAIIEVENILDREFLTGYTPVPLVGSPRLWRIGLRWNYSAGKRTGAFRPAGSM